MDEAELLDMGRRLMEKYEEVELEKKKMIIKMSLLQKKLAMIYTFGRELDMLIEDDSNYPIIIKYMVERIRGIASQLLFEDPNDEEPDITILF